MLSNFLIAFTTGGTPAGGNLDAAAKPVNNNHMMVIFGFLPLLLGSMQRQNHVGSWNSS